LDVDTRTTDIRSQVEPRSEQNQKKLEDEFFTELNKFEEYELETKKVAGGQRPSWPNVSKRKKKNFQKQKAVMPKQYLTWKWKQLETSISIPHHEKQCLLT
jgi:hypothetical protein